MSSQSTVLSGWDAVQDFRKLKVWERSHDLALAVYAATAAFPKEEQFGLTSQIRRSASSVPSNIAEGCGRDGNSEFRRFLFIALGSANELEYQLLLARDLGFIPLDDHERLAAATVEVKMMPSSLIAKVKGRGSEL